MTTPEGYDWREDEDDDHYQAAADAYQGAYRLGVDRAECLDLAVDVARKPLLVEIERLNMAVTNAKAAADVFERTMNAAGDYGRCLQSEDATLKAELADARAEVERLKANQLPDGGEWVTECGHLGLDNFCACASSSDTPTHQRCVWLGPVKPIEAEKAGE